MDPDFVFIVPYECPRCHASLESRVIGPPAWLRCPKCGRASLPPELTRSAPRIDDQTLVIGQFPSMANALPIRPRAMAPRPSAIAPKTPTARLILGTGFFLTMFLFLFSLLDPNRVQSTLFGGAAAFFLFLLARPAAPPSRE